MPSPHILQVNVSHGGIPKTPVAGARLTWSRVEGDDWSNKRVHGLPGQAVCLFSAELIAELAAEGFPLFPGALGENLTTAGIDYRMVRIGDLFTVGADAQIRITKIRVPCKTITVYGSGIREATYDEEVKRGNVAAPKWGRSGYYAEVVREGYVRPGDPMVPHTRA